MQFLKTTVADFQLRSKISRAIAELTTNSKLTLNPGDCEPVIELAYEHPRLVLFYIRERMSSSPTATYLAILLLDVLANSCSYSFHEVLAHEEMLQERLVCLAAERAESDSQRKVRSAARNMVLDFSRTFFDDPRLVVLSRLAARVEARTGRKLLRSIQVERQSVRIIDPRPEDIVLISPIRRGRDRDASPTTTIAAMESSNNNNNNSSAQVGDVSSSAGDTNSASSSSSAMSEEAAYWPCEVCTFVNSKHCAHCTACGSPRPLLDSVVLSSPTTTHPPSHHKQKGNVHPGHMDPCEGVSSLSSSIETDAPHVAVAEEDAVVSPVVAARAQSSTAPSEDEEESAAVVNEAQSTGQDVAEQQQLEDTVESSAFATIDEEEETNKQRTVNSVETNDEEGDKEDRFRPPPVDSQNNATTSTVAVPEIEAESSRPSEAEHTATTTADDESASVPAALVNEEQEEQPQATQIQTTSSAVEPIDEVKNEEEEEEQPQQQDKEDQDKKKQQGQSKKQRSNEQKKKRHQ